MSVVPSAPVSGQLSSLGPQFGRLAGETRGSVLDSRREANLNLWRVILGIAMGRLIRNHARNVNDSPPFTVSDAADNAGNMLIQISYFIPRLFRINLDRPGCDAALQPSLPPIPRRSGAGGGAREGDCGGGGASDHMKRYRIRRQTIDTHDGMGCLLRDLAVPAFKLRQLSNLRETLLLDAV